MTLLAPDPAPESAPDPTVAVGAPPTVRDSRDGDVAAIHGIYAFHVLHGLASFEEQPPAVDEMARRRAAVIAAGYPHLVAELDGAVVGYSYASAYRPRPAYRFTIENSVYVQDGLRGRGVGRALLGALIDRCEAGPWRQMIAVIGDTGNEPSIGLHAAFGFRRVGTLQAVGFKFGRWVDSVLMQRALGSGEGTDPG
ncbi:N-acetyltransferase family protein [Thalassobaculum sp.]|uniref:GNAT family N-acetyltransferase n=1 Tax=Thalassobaculum sp. TaxID=2022740 RepID=UPI0032EB8E7F